MIAAAKEREQDVQRVLACCVLVADGDCFKRLCGMVNVSKGYVEKTIIGVEVGWRGGKGGIKMLAMILNYF